MGKGQRMLKRAKERDREMRYVTVDIETRDKNGVSDLLGDTVYITWCIDGHGYGLVSDDLTGWLLHEFLTPEHDGEILYAHNGFRFDFKRIDWERLAECHFSAQFSTGGDMSIKGVTLTLGGRTWFMRDTVLLLPMSLEKVTKTFAPDQQKIKRQKTFEDHSFHEHDPDDQAYAIQDAVGLWHAIAKVDALMRETFGVSIHDGITAPSLAFRAFRQGFEAEEQYPGINFELEHAARESYHGGQTLALDVREHTDVISIDCNSMYPYCMIQYPLPTGKVKFVQGCPLSHDPEKTLCLALVHIPQGVFPFLKTQDGSRRTGNFRGVLLGWYWKFELDYQEYLGASVEILESYLWSDTTDVAARFSRVCHDLRMSDYHGPIGATAKLLNNSLYGKFAQQSPDYQLVLSLERPEDARHVMDFETQDITPYLWYVPAEDNHSAKMTHWASHITAHARLELTRAMEKVGFEHVVYCDTDSIFLERQFLPRVQSLLGTEYGQFKVEKEMSSFQAVAPKAYKGELTNGSRMVRNKGIPQKELEKQGAYERLGEAGVQIEYVKSNNLSQMMVRSLGYGGMSQRTTATPRSTTNGVIIEDKWEPRPCEIRPLEEVRGHATPLYMQQHYDRVYSKVTVLEQYQGCGTPGKESQHARLSVSIRKPEGYAHGTRPAVGS